MSNLPTIERPINLSGDLAEFIEGLLEPLSGKDRERGREIVQRVYSNGEPATSADWHERYTSAFHEAKLIN